MQLDVNTDAAALQQSLVAELKEKGFLGDPRIESAFASIPRHLFLPGVPFEEVYRDTAVVTRKTEGSPLSSSTQPGLMAIMLEQLDVRPGQNILEVGAATGYNAAIMAHLVGRAGQVTTIDIDEDIVAETRANLERAGYGQVRVVCGDGSLGYAEGGPYDRIILTVGSWDIAPAWREQLKEGGRLLMPLALARGGLQKLVAFEKRGALLAGVSSISCNFIMLRGAHSMPDQSIQLGPSPGLRLQLNSGERQTPDAAAMHELLKRSGRITPANVEITPRELRRSLHLWLSLRAPDFCVLHAEGETANLDRVPYLLGLAGKSHATMGLLGERGLALLTRRPGSDHPAEPSHDDTPFELYVKNFGDDDSPAQELITLVNAWDAAGRFPDDEQLSVLAYPRDADTLPSSYLFL